MVYLRGGTLNSRNENAPTLSRADLDRRFPTITEFLIANQALQKLGRESRELLKDGRNHFSEMIIFVRTDEKGRVERFPVPTTVIDPIRQLIGSTDDRNVYPISSTSLNRLSVSLIEQTLSRSDPSEVFDSSSWKFGEKEAKDATERPVLGINIQYREGYEDRYDVWEDDSKFWTVKVTRERDANGEKPLGDKPWAEFLRQLHNGDKPWYKDTGRLSADSSENVFEFDNFQREIKNGDLDQVTIVLPFNAFNKHPNAVLTNILEIFVGAQQVPQNSLALIGSLLGRSNPNAARLKAASMDTQDIGFEIDKFREESGLGEKINQLNALDNFGLSKSDDRAVLATFIGIFRRMIECDGEKKEFFEQFHDLLDNHRDGLDPKVQLKALLQLVSKSQQGSPLREVAPLRKFKSGPPENAKEQLMDYLKRIEKSLAAARSS